MLSKFAQQRKISYPLLSDQESKVIKAYGVRNKAARGRGKGIPHPITIIVDQQRKIKAKLPGEIRRRHDTERLLEAVK